MLNLIGVEVLAYTVEIGGIKAETKGLDEIRKNVEANPLRCADPEATKEMERVIKQAREEGDSVGGAIEGRALNVPVGLGEPIFDTLEGGLSQSPFCHPGS